MPKRPRTRIVARRTRINCVFGLKECHINAQNDTMSNTRKIKIIVILSIFILYLFQHSKPSENRPF